MKDNQHEEALELLIKKSKSKRKWENGRGFDEEVYPRTILVVTALGLSSFGIYANSSTAADKDAL